MLSNKPPVIYGDGEQTRDFAFVKDVVKANMLAIQKNAEGVFNIASGLSTSINELAAKIIELAGKDFEPVYANERPGDIKHSLETFSCRHLTCREEAGLRA